MKRYDTEASLARLLNAIPPPLEPLEVSGPVTAPRFADGQTVSFPIDYIRLTNAFGSGDFHSDESDGEGAIIGDLVYLLNPRATGYLQRLTRESKFLHEFKQSEGDSYIPHEVFPRTPGVLQWGWCEGRKHFFWLTEGRPEEWPVLVMYDLEIWTRFDMPMVVFLEKLFCGELDCSFIGWTEEFSRRDPTKIKFNPRIPPPG